MSVAPTPPPSGQWTPAEFDALPDDGYRRELIEGVLHVAATPSGRHQFLAALLTMLLHNSAPATFRATQGVEVELSPRLRYVPDVLVVTADAFGDGRAPRYDPADVVLAVEIVSESSRSMDRLLKPHHYAAAGIPYFWRIELEPRLSVSTYAVGLSGDYQSTGEFTKVLAVTEPWPVEIDLASLPV